jgi:hypothetical protein
MRRKPPSVRTGAFWLVLCADYFSENSAEMELPSAVVIVAT